MYIKQDRFIIKMRNDRFKNINIIQNYIRDSINLQTY